MVGRRAEGARRRSAAGQWLKEHAWKAWRETSGCLGSFATACFSDKRLDSGSFVLWGEMRVSKRHRQRLVPEQLTNGIEIDASHHQLARERMPQIVKTEACHCTLSSRSRKADRIRTTCVVRLPETLFSHASYVSSRSARSVTSDVGRRVGMS